jgi:hypothetical protein
VTSAGVAGAYGKAYANMGWVGFVRVLGLDTTDTNRSFLLRVTSCDLKLRQEIETPEVIDGRIDRSVYKLGPKIVEGTLAMPLVADVQTVPSDGCVDPSEVQGQTSVAGALVGNLWCWATSRDSYGRPAHHNVKLEVRYANHAAFTFDRALVNTFSLSVRAQEEIKLDIGLWARSRTPTMENPVAGPALDGTNGQISDFLAPARVFTWNDISINAVCGCDNDAGLAANDLLFSSSQVREFSMEVNNNAERYYTLNGTLYPADINVRKREITGTLKLMGLSERMRMLAETNQRRFTEKNRLRIALYVGDDTADDPNELVEGNYRLRDWLGSDTAPTTAIWATQFVGTVFNIEEMELTNDLFETTINWHALASDIATNDGGDRTYEAFQPGTSCSFPIWRA